MPRNKTFAQFLIDCLDNPAKAMATSLPSVLDSMYPEAGVAARVAGHFAKQTAATMRLDSGASQEFLSSIREQGWGIYPIMGLPDTGKTYFAMWLARFVGNPNNFELGMPAHQRPAWAQTLNNVTDIVNLPPRSTVILDDIAQMASIYSYGNKGLGQALTEAVARCRHLQLTVIATGQTTGPVTLRLFEVLETFFWKPPPLAADFQRPAVRKMAKMAQQAFYGKPLAWQRRHVFVWSTRYIGMLEYAA